MMAKIYQISKEDCAKQISGVCPGCGGELEPIETVNNSNQPTYWVGCMHCQSFCCGVDKHTQKLARSIVESGYLSQCFYKRRCEYEDTPERLEYWKDTEKSNMTQVILHIFAKDKKMKEAQPNDCGQEDKMKLKDDEMRIVELVIKRVRGIVGETITKCICDKDLQMSSQDYPEKQADKRRFLTEVEVNFNSSLDLYLDMVREG